jgi:hypothetical protein
MKETLETGSGRTEWITENLKRQGCETNGKTDALARPRMALNKSQKELQDGVKNLDAMMTMRFPHGDEVLEKAAETMGLLMQLKKTEGRIEMAPPNETNQSIMHFSEQKAMVSIEKWFNKIGSMILEEDSSAAGEKFVELMHEWKREHKPGYELNQVPAGKGSELVI